MYMLKHQKTQAANMIGTLLLRLVTGSHSMDPDMRISHSARYSICPPLHVDAVSKEFHTALAQTNMVVSVLHSVMLQLLLHVECCANCHLAACCCLVPVQLFPPA